MIQDKDTILFIGLGGAGQRHLRIFRNLLPNNKFIALRNKCKTPLLKSDFTIDNSSTIEKNIELNVLMMKKIIKHNPKLTIIATPYFIIDKIYSLLAHSMNSNVFVEKPGIASKNDFLKISTKFLHSKLVYKVGFQRSLLPIIKKLKV